MSRRWLIWMYRWIEQICDPLRLQRGCRAYLWFFADWRKYASLPYAESIHFLDTWPQLHDRTTHTSIDTHYFYVNGWAMRRIVAHQPSYHVDVGSQNLFVNLLGAVLPVLFVDYRPLDTNITGLNSVGGNILNLPFAENSVRSISCLHVAEHIGLGRYGDSLDPRGTWKAARELSRILAPGGNLYFAVPIGRERLCFNGARIHYAETILDYFAGLDLVEYSGVSDDGRFVERASLSKFNVCDYACGMFWFKKPELR